MATDPDCVRRLRELVENGAVPPESLRAELTVVAADVLREYDRILFTLDTERACQRDRDRLRNDEASAYRRAAETLRAECADLRAELARVERDAADVRGRAAYAVGADSLLSEARAEINRLHETLRAVARACTLPEDTAPAAVPGAVEACIRDLSGQIERLTLAATATTGAEDALTGLVALKTAAVRAYLEMDGGRTDAITPEVDSGAEPRLALTLDLGGTEGGEPWQALVIYDAGMGTVPVTSGECCGTPLAAVASLRADLQHNDDTEDDCEFDHF